MTRTAQNCRDLYDRCQLVEQYQVAYCRVFLVPKECGGSVVAAHDFGFRRIPEKGDVAKGVQPPGATVQHWLFDTNYKRGMAGEGPGVRGC